MNFQLQRNQDRLGGANQASASSTRMSTHTKTDGANTGLDADVCTTCFQPECPLSTGGSRPEPATHSTILNPGEHDYRGYCEWAVHPDEAIFILHRGYAIVDGERVRVQFVHTEAFVTQLLIADSEQVRVLETKLLETVPEPEVRVAVHAR